MVGKENSMITIRVVIDEELHKQAKSRAALEGVPLAAWIATAIEQRLAQPVKAQKKAKVKA
jgi:predicted HicB family RNase H-like nuclease